MNNVEKTKEPYEAPVLLDINPVTVNGAADPQQSTLNDPNDIDDQEGG